MQQQQYQSQQGQQYTQENQGQQYQSQQYLGQPSQQYYTTQPFSTQSSVMHEQTSNASQSVAGFPEGAQARGLRRIQSTVIGEEFLEPLPEETVRYVEIPYIEERIRQVPKKEIVEVEKKVPKYEIEYIERIVEVPQIQYIDKTVEVPQVHEVLKHVPRYEVIEVPKEIVRHVPKIETKVVEKVVEVPGEIIEVPKPYTVERKVTVPHYVDRDVPMVVAQTLKPVLGEANEHIDVEVIEYEPEMIPVDIHVPKAVPSQVISMGVVDEIHRVVNVPSAQYNSMLRFLNPHIATTEHESLPYRTHQGSVQFSTDNISHVRTVSGANIQGWTGQKLQSESGCDGSSDTTATTSRATTSRASKSKHRGSAISSKPAMHMRDISASGYGGHYKHSPSSKGTKRARGVCPC